MWLRFSFDSDWYWNNGVIVYKNDIINWWDNEAIGDWTFFYFPCVLWLNKQTQVSERIYYICG